MQKISQLKKFCSHIKKVCFHTNNICSHIPKNICLQTQKTYGKQRQHVPATNSHCKQPRPIPATNFRSKQPRQILTASSTANSCHIFSLQIVTVNYCGSFPREILEYVNQKMVWINLLRGRVSHVKIKRKQITKQKFINA